MLYTRFSNLLKKEIRKGVKTYGDRFCVSIGCLNTGILGNERIMSPKELEQDLEIVQNEGISKVYIYSLAGMTKEYARILEQYS